MSGLLISSPFSLMSLNYCVSPSISVYEPVIDDVNLISWVVCLSLFAMTTCWILLLHVGFIKLPYCTLYVRFLSLRLGTAASSNLIDILLAIKKIHKVDDKWPFVFDDISPHQYHFFWISFWIFSPYNWWIQQDETWTCGHQSRWQYTKIIRLSFWDKAHCAKSVTCLLQMF